MTVYPTTLCFAYNKPSQTVFYCMECAKDKWGEEPHEERGVMMVPYETEMSFIRCHDCSEVILDE